MFNRMSGETRDNASAGCALITGGAKRIGAAITRRLHAAGFSVAVHYRSSSGEASSLCAELNAAQPDSAQCFQANLIDTSACEQLVDSVIDWQGRMDALVNNASTFYPTPLGKISAADFEDLVGSNLKAPLFLSQAAWPHLKSSRGSIVNIVDIHAQRPLRQHIVYGAAKAGLVMLTRSLAKELAPDVRVNGIAPGAIEWPASGMSDAVKASIIDQIPLGRTGEPADIANGVLFLVRDASYVSGQVIAIDGGRSLGW